MSDYRLDDVYIRDNGTVIFVYRHHNRTRAVQVDPRHNNPPVDLGRVDIG